MKGFLAQWGLLGAGVLAASLLALHIVMGHQQASPGSTSTVDVTPVISPLGPIYTLDQVLAGWHQHPDQWTERPILVRASSAIPCDAPPLPPPDDLETFPCTLIYRGESYSLLYDQRSSARIPAIADASGRDDTIEPLALPRDDSLYQDPVAVFQVRFVTRPDCGPLGNGQHPCLLGVGPQRVGAVRRPRIG